MLSRRLRGLVLTLTSHLLSTLVSYHHSPPFFSLPSTAPFSASSARLPLCDPRGFKLLWVQCCCLCIYKSSIAPQSLWRTFSCVPTPSFPPSSLPLARLVSGSRTALRARSRMQLRPGLCTRLRFGVYFPLSRRTALRVSCLRGVTLGIVRVWGWRGTPLYTGDRRTTIRGRPFVASPQVLYAGGVAGHLRSSHAEPPSGRATHVVSLGALYACARGVHHLASRPVDC